MLLDAPDNNVSEKILFSVVFMLLGQHCTCQNLVQCCPKGSRCECTEKKNHVPCCLNVLGTTLHRSKPCGLYNIVREAPDNIIQEKIFESLHIAMASVVLSINLPVLMKKIGLCVYPSYKNKPILTNTLNRCLTDI